MPLRTIIGPSNPVLRRKAHAVPVADIKKPAFQQLIDDMIETMRQAPGVGLAAPQVAVPQQLAVIEYADVPDDLPEGAEPPPAKLYVIINPEITNPSKEMVNGSEGCLSLPGYAGTVARHEALTIKALNRQGHPIKIKAKGWLARIFQHEIDHLEGVLFIDRAIKVWKISDSDEEPPVAE